MKKTLVVLGMMETKGVDAACLVEKIHDLNKNEDIQIMVIDIGLRGEAIGIVPNITRYEVAQVGGYDFNKDIRDCKDGISKMAECIKKLIAILYKLGKCYGIASVDDELNLITCAAIGVLPESVPKFMDKYLTEVPKHFCFSMNMQSIIQGEPLALPLKIGALTSKNRFCIQPMEGADSDGRGCLTQDSIQRYMNYCEGGAGVIFVEAVALQPETRYHAKQLLINIHNPENRASWESFIRQLKLKYPSTLILVQFHHPGGTMDVDYLDRYIDLQVDTCEFLYSIGFDGVDLKFCHGYLGSQLLRPNNNHNWKYGGSWENRSRFAFDLCEKIRAAIPDQHFLVGAKTGIYEDFAGGQGHIYANNSSIDFSESIALIKGLEARGCNYFSETLGNSTINWALMCPDRATSYYAYVHMATAKMMKENLKPETCVIGVGLSVLGAGAPNGIKGEGNSYIQSATYCIKTGSMDMIGLGRQALADPFLPLKYLAGKEKEINWCKTCNCCFDLLMGMQHVGCTVYNKKYANLMAQLR